MLREPEPEPNEGEVEVDGVPTRYLSAGEGPAMVLLHADGENRQDWRWVLPSLGRHFRVVAPDLPGFGGTAPRGDCSPEFFQRFVHHLLDRLELDTAVLVGNSLGGLAALRVALASPDRVSALCLVAGAGLGSEVSPALRMLTTAGLGEAAISWGRTPIGAAQRSLLRVPLLFPDPTCVPQSWLAEQYRLALLPGFLETTLASLRAQIDGNGQRQVLLEELPRLPMRTLIVWGDSDRVLPVHQAHDAASRVPCGHLEVMARTGHLPHVQRPDRFAAVLTNFLEGSRPQSKSEV